MVDCKGKLRSAKATKKGAKTELKGLKNNTYISDFTGELTDCGSGLEIVEINEGDLFPLDSCQLWYNTLWYEYKHLAGRSFNFKKFYHIIDKYDLQNPIDFKGFVERYGEMAQKGEFKPVEKYEKNKIDLEGF